MKQPIIPECFDVAADELADLSLLAAGTTVPADAVGQDQEDAAPDPADLDVPSGAADLLRALHDDGRATLTRTDVEAVAAEAEGVPDRADRTIRNWVQALVDAGALDATGERRDRSEILRVLGN